MLLTRQVRQCWELTSPGPAAKGQPAECFIFIFLQPTEAWFFYYIICTVLQCDLPPIRPHCGEAPPGRHSKLGRVIYCTVEAARPLHLLKKFIVSYFPPSMNSITNQQNILRQHLQSLKRNESPTHTFVKKQHSQPWSTVRDNISCLYVQRQGDNNRQQPLPMKLHETVTLHETNRQLQWISRDSIPYQQRSRR